MGLDSSLVKKTYIGANFEHRGITGKIELYDNSGKKINIKFNRVSSITEEVAYWRKANAIHKFFVDNVQDGNDDCGEYYVPREVLEKLLVYCGFVLDNPSEAPKALPTQEGFFFGTTQYDENYFEDLRYTKEIINELLKTEEGDYYYHASW